MAGSFLNVNTGKLILPAVLIVLGLWILWGILLGEPSAETKEVAIPLEGAAQAHVRIHHGAGRLRVAAGADPGDLLTGEFAGGLDHRVKREGDTLDVAMRVPAGWGPHFVVPWVWGPGRMLDWSLVLNGEVPLSLDLETGASDARLDLSNLRVTDLRLETGASATDVTMPAHAGYTRAVIRSGAASLAIRVPPGVAARIRVGGGLAGISVDRNRFPREGGMYRSQDYDTAPNKADVDVETGVGSINIR